MNESFERSALMGEEESDSNEGGRASEGLRLGLRTKTKHDKTRSAGMEGLYDGYGACAERDDILHSIQAFVERQFNFMQATLNLGSTCRVSLFAHQVSGMLGRESEGDEGARAVEFGCPILCEI